MTRIFLILIFSARVCIAQDDFPPSAIAAIVAANGASSGGMRGQDIAGAWAAGVLNYYPMSAYGLTTTGAINTFYAGKWYLFGTTLTTMKYNFINTSLYTLTDINTATYNSSGITTNAGANKCVSTGFNPSTNGADVMGVQIYYSSISTTGDNNMMGASATNFIYFNAGGTVMSYGLSDNGSTSFTTSAFGAVSHYVQRRATPNGTTLKYYQSGVLKKTSTTTAGTRPAFALYAGAMNASGSVNKAATGTISYIGVTSGTEMTDAQVTESYNIDEKVRTITGK